MAKLNTMGQVAGKLADQDNFLVSKKGRDESIILYLLYILLTFVEYIHGRHCGDTEDING